jgi:hypothetical protein
VEVSEVTTYVWFVPGFMGSSLGLYPTSGGQRAGPKIASLWGTLTSVGNLPRVSLLRLPSTLPVGQGIFADGLADVAGQGYGEFLAWIDANTPSGTTPFPWPYDWRLSCRDTGAALATALQESAAGGNSNILLCHSQGALVGWCAWAALVDRSATAALSKWITFGGALYGTTSTPSIFREEEDSLALLARIKSGVATATNPLTYAMPAATITILFLSVAILSDAQIAELIALAATWPGIYDLYPDVHALDDEKDLDRGLLFDVNNWLAALALPSSFLIGQSITRVHEYVRQGIYLPPSTLTAHIVGTGHVTPHRVQPAQSRFPTALGPWPSRSTLSSPAYGRQWQMPSFSTTTEGDGRCTVAQQRFPGRYWQSVGSQHASMQNDPAVRALIVSMIGNPVPQRAVLNPVSVVSVEPWAPPVAPTGLPAFLFNSDPVTVTARAPVLPPRVGQDP